MSIVGAIAVPHPPLIVPAVGRGDEQRIQSTIRAYTQAAEWLLQQQPDCLVVSSPHAPLFRDAFHITTESELRGSMARFNAPQESMVAQCDVPLAQAIISQASEAGIPCVGSDRYAEDMDHGTYVPLYFLREAAGGNLPCPIVRIGLSGLSPQVHKHLGSIVATAAESLGRRVGYVASGDLSHKLLAEGPYGFAPEGPVFDDRIGQIFASGNLEELFSFDEAFCEAAAECGLRSFQIMAGALDGYAVTSKLLSNEGPFGVGYGVAMCAVEGATQDAPQPAQDTPQPAQENAPQQDAPRVDPHIALARLSVETFVRTGKRAQLPPDVPPDLLHQQAGAFVSLHEHGELRGCIGTISPTCNCIAEEILQNGVSACSGDPRFYPVREDELDYLEYSVDVLGQPEPISSPDQLDPKRYGVIVEKGYKRGLLLPNLEGVDTVDYQLSIAKQKAGISPHDQNVQLQRFEVVRHTAGGQPRKQS